MRLGEMYDLVRKPWGGLTMDTYTTFPVPDGIDAYAVSALRLDEQGISIPEYASFIEFLVAYNDAQAKFNAPYLGIFHDDSKGTIDFDPVVLAWSTEQVDTLYRLGYPVAGGAYHFTDGIGYWPGGRPAEYQNTEEKVMSDV